MKSKLNLLYIPLYFWSILFLLDNFLKDYEGHDRIEFNIKTYIIIFVTAIIILFISFYNYFLEKDKFIKAAKSFAYSILFSLSTLIYIALVKDQTLFYLNRIYVKEKKIEIFDVVNIWEKENQNKITIESSNGDYLFFTKNKFNTEINTKMFTT